MERYKYIMGFKGFKHTEETKRKIVTVIMGQDCEKFIGMALESVKDSDAIVYCDGGSEDMTLPYLHEKGFSDDYPEYKDGGGEPVNKIIINNKYNQEDKGMNGKQRNFYLDYVKKNYPGWWCLVLDADEVLDVNGIKKIREMISKIEK